jgi:DNA polymerase-3 subunit epsilon
VSEPSPGILDRPVMETPLAVLDFETTGLNAGGDRVIEVAVVRLEPGRGPHLVLDTLVNPQRPVAATHIHGISDRDVIDAPTFREIAVELVRALDGCVLAAYNAYFDVRFLDWEMRAASLADRPPFLCLMYLRPLLGLGCRCGLDRACRAHGIDHSTAHTAADDALAAARLWGACVPAMVDRNIRTFRDLAEWRRYKFTESFTRPPLKWTETLLPPLLPRLKPRGRPLAASINT